MAAAPDAGFFCDYAVRYLEQAGLTEDQLDTGGYTIKTTMDPVVSQSVKDAVDRNVPTTQDGVANTFAVVTPGTAGHEVLAMVANRNLGTDAAQGGAVDQHRRRPEQRLRRGLVVQDLHDGGGAGAGHRRLRLRPAQPRLGLLHPAEQQPLHALLPGRQRRRLRRPDLPPGRARDLAERGVRRPGDPHRHARGRADGASGWACDRRWRPTPRAARRSPTRPTRCRRTRSTTSRSRSTSRACSRSPSA